MADLALIGLAVMGQNFILNLNDHGFKVVAYNRTVSKITEFLEKEAKGTQVIGATSLEDLVSKLKMPRIIVLLVMAGQPVDIFINNLKPLLSPGDIIVDGGNSEFHDTTRRCQALADEGLLYVGCGVSGGEDGARCGPSLMPGGNKAAWPHIKPIFQAIAAKSESGPNGIPCCDWLGNDGCGHFVKMVHNGIEYGDMQLISEAYHLMRSHPLCLSNQRMSEIFREWSRGSLNSFLIEITANILTYKDDAGEYVVDKILDSASQKGTGKWTVLNGLDFSSPITLIAESVFARCLSVLKEDRLVASQKFTGPPVESILSQEEISSRVDDIRMALYASKIISYTQGFALIREASKQFHWELDFGNIALLWRGGCIIQSRFLGNIKEAFERDPDLANLLLDDYFGAEVSNSQAGWRRAVCRAVKAGVPLPAMSCALSFFDGFRCSRLPANLIQAQRDYFGAHMYQLVDSPGSFHHTNWTGHGGSAAASAYEL